VLLALALLAAATADSEAATFAWKSKFTSASSQALAELHEQIYTARPEELVPYPVSATVWAEEDFELNMESGTLFVEPPIQGVTTGVFFEGRATVSFTPKGVTPSTALRMSLGKESLEKIPIRTAYIFTLRSNSPLASLTGGVAGGAASSLSQRETYLTDKSAMRQLGLDLLTAFLNRDSTAKGTTYVLFAIDEIRKPRSEEARLLYAFIPMAPQPISLAVFGHEDMVDFKPFKFKFYELASYAGSTSVAGPDLERSSVKLLLGTGATPAQEEAQLDLHLPSGLRALRLNLSIVMEVSQITGPGEAPLEFLQWERLQNDPDFDQTVLIQLPERSANPGKDAMSINVKSAGVLFEPFGGTFYLVDEDDWFPRPPATNDEAHHELELTLPRQLDGIGIGEKVLDAPSGNGKRILYRTTQPVDQSTLYYGDYTKTEGMADSINVELYQGRADVNEQKHAKFIMTEITNVLKVFNRMFVPLDIKNLRVTSTLTGHGRGFEGLLLLGGGGTGTVSDSGADIFRAHEVAHQWWGNYVRTKYWPQDRWLSESFAEYAAMEYYKVRFQDQKKTIQVMTETWLQPLTEGSRTTETLSGGKESVVGGTVYPIAAGTNNVYTKGPMVLNMLRYLFSVQKGNDDAFFPMLKDFLQTYKYQAASTPDFRKVAEKHFGQGLGWFFDQWIEDGGLPVLLWAHEIVQEEGAFVLKLEAKQEQKKYRLVVPIYIRFPGDKLVVRPWVIEGESATRSIKLPSKPDSVSLNDNLEALLILKNLRAL
jgi:hypothetical protein